LAGAKARRLRVLVIGNSVAAASIFN
jgi:hypothetical protein